MVPLNRRNGSAVEACHPQNAGRRAEAPTSSTFPKYLMDSSGDHRPRGFYTIILLGTCIDLKARQTNLLSAWRVLIDTIQKPTLRHGCISVFDQAAFIVLRLTFPPDSTLIESHVCQTHVCSNTGDRQRTAGTWLRDDT